MQLTEGRPPAFVASAAFGVVGVVLILVGFASGVHGILYAGLGFGTASLISALVWRGELITAWRAQKR